MNNQLKRLLLPLLLYLALLLTSSTALGLTLSPLTGPTYTGDLSVLEKKKSDKSISFG